MSEVNLIQEQIKIMELAIEDCEKRVGQYIVGGGMCTDKYVFDQKRRIGSHIITIYELLSKSGKGNFKMYSYLREQIEEELAELGLTLEEFGGGWSVGDVYYPSLDDVIRDYNFNIYG